MKYNLKTIVVGYEVPLLDLDKESQDQLINEINSNFDVTDDVVSSFIDSIELHTSNFIFDVIYVFKVNVGEMTIDKIRDHFNDLRSKIELVVEDFLKSRKIFYQKIESN